MKYLVSYLSILLCFIPSPGQGADPSIDLPKSYLMDSHGLLQAREASDTEAFLAYHAQESLIDIYVYIFPSDEEIPENLSLKEIAKSLDQKLHPALILYYFYGSPERTEMLLSQEVSKAVSPSEQRRALQSAIMSSSGKTSPFEQLKAFLVQQSIRLYWMERMMTGAADKTSPTMPEGEGFRVFPKTEKGMTAPALGIPPWLLSAAYAVVLGGISLLTLFIFLRWRLSKATYFFPEARKEPRLGGDYGAGIGAVISFSSPTISTAQQKKQKPF